MDALKLLIFCLCFCTSNAIFMSLNGIWKGYILSSGTSFVAEVPGGVYNDLEKVKVIPKNLVGFNDVRNRWVGNESISYVKNFEVNNRFLGMPYIILIFHGLDTFATIYVNNIEIGKSSNMYLRYSFDIKKYLKISTNELKVVFLSPVKTVENLYKIQKKKYLVPPACVPKAYHGECHINFARKMQASFGWDWGPAFPSMGIWKNVELVTVYNIMVSDITTDILKNNDTWQIYITIFFKTFGEKNISIDKITHINCTLENQWTISKMANLNVKDNCANISLLMEVPIDKIEMWWPNGYGKQKLYTLIVKVKTERDILEKKIKIGFRTVSLVQNPLKEGLTFYFTVNEIPIFAKGSNWIPSSIFPEVLEKEKTLQHLLKSVKDTHMNMLRVWGGGIYESDLFYSIADEYGIMIWQDFMFACSMYPSTNSFLNNVKEEIIQNMRRLKNHASIVLWAGNNENEAALFANWYGTDNSQIYKNDYIKLYVDTIKNIVLKNDLSRAFVVSSPSNGLYSEQKNYTESDPYNHFYGDVHYYNYEEDSWNINQYPISRFASEYGFQAFPSIWTLMTVIEHSKDLKINSSFLDHRQHLNGGNYLMTFLINNNLEIPKSNNTIRQIMDYIYLSQISQAVSVKIQTESYRQLKSSFNNIGEGLTMGALYWQLNDVWQAPSWSSIDFEGRWKMLHYFAKDFFYPVIITSRLTRANELLIYVVSDLLNKLTNLTVEITVYEWQSSKAINTVKLHNVKIEPNESLLIKKFWLDKFLVNAGCGTLCSAKENCIIELLLKDFNNNKIAPSNYVYPTPLKQVSLPNDLITINVQPKIISNTSANENEFYIEITSQKLALFVWLEFQSIVGQFSDNGFHIFDKKKNIIFRSYQNVSVKEISESLTITSLSRIYDSNLRLSDVQLVTDELIRTGKYTS